MNPEETARVLTAASRCAEAAAHLLLVPSMADNAIVEELVTRSQQLVAHAKELGAVPKKRLD